MRTFDEAIASQAWTDRLRRDLRVLIRILWMAYAYLTTGARVRREYRDGK